MSAHDNIMAWNREGKGSAMTEQYQAIDLQTHFMPATYINMFLKRDTWPYIREEENGYFFQYGPESGYSITPSSYEIDDVLDQMEKNNLGKVVLSINMPGAEVLPDDDGIDIAKAINDGFIEIARQYPKKFYALATLPWRSTRGAEDELDRLCDYPEFVGIMTFSNVDGIPLDDKRFWPIYAQAQDMGWPLYLHPTRPVIAPYVKEYGLEGMLGYVYDTSLAAMRLILGGVIDAFPNLNVIVPHAGGVLPYLAGRIDHQSRLIAGASKNIKKKPSDYIANFYMDTVCLSSETLRLALDMVGEDRIVFATDYPFVPVEKTMSIIDVLGLSNETKKKILKENAKQLFGF